MIDDLDKFLAHYGISRENPPTDAQWNSFLSGLESQNQLMLNLEKSLMDEKDTAIFIFDLSSLRIVKANLYAAQLLGYTDSSELIGEHARKHLSDESWIQAQEIVAKLLNGETVQPYERTLRRADGAMVHSRTSISLIYDRNGTPVFIKSNISDITEHKLLTTDLNNKEHYLNTILNNTPIILMACDTQAIITLLEGNGLSKVNIDPQQAIGKTVFDLFAQFPQIQNAVNNALMGELSELEFTVSNRVYRSIFFPVWENDFITGAVGFAQDNSELIFAKRKLEVEEAHARRVQEFTEAILNNTSDGIAVLNFTGKIQQNNEAFAILFNLPSQENYNTSFTSLFDEKYTSDLNKSIEYVLKHLKPIRLEVEAIGYSNNRFYADVSISPIITKNKDLTALVVSIRDISSYKYMEDSLANARDQALESARLKSEFLAVMSHEIRTPLNLILGVVEILQDTPLNSDQTELVDILEDQGKTLRYLINNILDYSKIGAQKMILEHETFVIRELIERLSNHYQFEARNKKLDFVVDISEDVPLNMVGDSHRLYQILNVLLSNAIKFTNEGEIILRVSGTDLLTFSVSDTGIGIPTEALEYLFEPFTQVDSSHTRLYGGTGLGLAIAYKIVQLMGSELLVNSEIGKGTEFRFVLNSDNSPERE